MSGTCNGCIYNRPLCSSSHEATYCAYILITGRRRPCPPGEGCTVKRTGTRRRIDWDAAKAVYDRGGTDREIAQAVECAVISIKKWRKRNGLPPRGGMRYAEK